MDLTPGFEIRCPECRTNLTAVEYQFGREHERGPVRQELVVKPCGHRFVGPEAGERHARIKELLAAYRAGREDAAKAIEQDPNSRDCFWDTADSWWNGYDAAKERAAALARGQHTTERGSE